MYPEKLVHPIREKTKKMGFKELKTPDEVRSHLDEEKGTTLLLINSVCGCAARTARPGLESALKATDRKPNHLASVFAGVDFGATATARRFIENHPPSSPSIALFKDGKLVHFVPRNQIEGVPANRVGEQLANAINKIC